MLLPSHILKAEMEKFPHAMT